MNYFPVGNVSELKTTFLGIEKKLKGFIIENVDNLGYMRGRGFVVCNGNLYGIFAGLCMLTPFGWKDVPNSRLFTYVNSYTGANSTVVLNNEIHVLGNTTSGGSESSNRNHSKWDGTQWVDVSTLPYYFKNGSAVVYNDEIYIMGGDYYNNSSTSYRYVYKFDGTVWNRLADIPMNVTDFKLVVYDGKIHLIGGRYAAGSTTVYKYHYTFDGITWTKLADVPFERFLYLSTVYDGKIHIIGGINASGSSSASYQTNSHYTFDGTTWTNEGNIYINGDSGLYGGVALSYGGRLRMFNTESAVQIDGKWYFLDRKSDPNSIAGNNGNGGNIIIPVFK